MSVTLPALVVILVGALASGESAATDGPPELPPERTVAPSPPDGADTNTPPEPPPEPPPRTGPRRDSLPPGLAPIPFPLENQRRAAPPAGDSHDPPPAERRSIVDLRDPFNRPLPRVRAGEARPSVRLLMPDLKDPFAPGVRRVRSKTLDQRVPNDIIDPFRSPRPRAIPNCAKVTNDGTVVQAPGTAKKPEPGQCLPSQLDLRDPFDRDTSH